MAAKPRQLGVVGESRKAAQFDGEARCMGMSLHGRDGCPLRSDHGNDDDVDADFDPLQVGSPANDTSAPPDGLYFKDWPLHSDAPVSYNTACDIIMGALPLEEERVCRDVPQCCKQAGSFVINVENFSKKNDVVQDGLGSWGKPCGRARFYGYEQCTSGSRAIRYDIAGKLSREAPFDVKILCKHYEHPSARGSFFKKIYTGLCPAPREHLPLVVVTYEWRGQPVDIAVVKAAPPSRALPNVPVDPRSFEGRRLRALAAGDAHFDGCPLYAHLAVEFAEAAELVLGAKPVEFVKVSRRVPQCFRGVGTFVVDLRNLPAPAAIRDDGNGVWSKPAGSSRYYQLDEASGDALRVDHSHKLDPGAHFDVQVLVKRYEHPGAQNKFVRKIYVGRANGARPMESCCQLAVITYYWKGEPFDFTPDKRRVQSMQRISGVTLLPPPPPADLSMAGGMLTSDMLLLDGSGAECDDAVPPDCAANVTLDSSSDYSPVAAPSHAAVPIDHAAIFLPGRVGRTAARPAASFNRKRRLSDDAFRPAETAPRPLEEVRRSVLQRALSNQQRFGALLDRAESLFDRFEDSGIGQLWSQMAGNERVVVRADPQHSYEDDFSSDVRNVDIM